MTPKPPTHGGNQDDAVPVSLRTCRFHVAGVRVRVIFCPEATVANIHETMPTPQGIEIIMASEEPGPGCFQVQLVPTEPLLERAEVAGDGHAEKAT